MDNTSILKYKLIIDKLVSLKLKTYKVIFLLFILHIHASIS